MRSTIYILDLLTQFEHFITSKDLKANITPQEYTYLYLTNLPRPQSTQLVPYETVYAFRDTLTGEDRTVWEEFISLTYITKTLITPSFLVTDGTAPSLCQALGYLNICQTKHNSSYSHYLEEYIHQTQTLGLSNSPYELAATTYRTFLTETTNNITLRLEHIINNL